MGRKYMILIGDGMADDPLAELGGKTPLETAAIPHLHHLAQRGRLGLVRTVPPGFPPGSDVANLSIFGYDPACHYTGRAPLEAAAMGVRLGPRDVAFRLNLITLRQEGQGVMMEDFSAGHISTEEAREAVTEIARVLGGGPFEFHPGVSYRHLMVWRDGERSLALRTTPPHDLTGKEVSPFLPAGEGEKEIRDVMDRARALLGDSPVNRRRRLSGQRPANAIWLWGQGKAPVLRPLTQRFGLSGSVISAVDLMKGIGFYAGLEIVHVPGATGYLDTNYAGKAEHALRELARKDFVYLHVEAPDEAAHNGNLRDKIRAIEDFDARIVGPIRQGLSAYDDFRLLVLPDHPTPIAVKTHTSDPVPFVLYSPADAARKPREDRSFNEASARRAGLRVEKGHKLIEELITGGALL